MCKDATGEIELMAESLQDIYERTTERIEKGYIEDVMGDLFPCVLADEKHVEDLLNGKEEDPREYFWLLVELMEVALDYIDSSKAKERNDEATIEELEKELKRLQKGARRK